MPKPSLAYSSLLGLFYSFAGFLREFLGAEASGNCWVEDTACWAWLCGLRVTGLERIRLRHLSLLIKVQPSNLIPGQLNLPVQEGLSNQIPWVLKKVLITRGAGSVTGKMISGAEIRLSLLALHGLFHTALLNPGSC